MKKITKVLAGLLIVGLFFSCKHNNTPNEEEQNQDQQQEQQGTSDPADNKPEQPKVIKAVVFNPASGEVEEGTKITLSTETEGAVIYYEFVKADAATTLTKENFKINKYAEPVEIKEAGTLYAIAAESETSTNVSEISSAAYTIKVVAPVVPEDAIRLWTAESTATAWSVYNFEDLEKLAEIVNGGKDLAGVTITQKEDITINEAVLGENFAEPEEAEAGVANANLKNFAGIGSVDHPFAGTYDGNGKKISGLYIYGGQQGLAFIGAVNGATVKNVTILDAAVINKNVWEGTKKDDKTGEMVPTHDGTDDDRFGGLIGVVMKNSPAVTIENCIFVGTVGSKAAYNRDDTYEYIGGILGRIDDNATLTINKSFSLVKLYGSAAALVKKVSSKATISITDSIGVSLDKKVYKSKDAESAKLDEEGGITKAEIIAAVKGASGIDLTDYFTKAGL